MLYPLSIIKVLMAIYSYNKLSHQNSFNSTARFYFPPLDSCSLHNGRPKQSSKQRESFRYTNAGIFALSFSLVLTMKSTEHASVQNQCINIYFLKYISHYKLSIWILPRNSLL